MPWSLDARIPIVMVADPAALAAALDAALAGGRPAALLLGRRLVWQRAVRPVAMPALGWLLV